jgi:hypothetical protein
MQIIENWADVQGRIIEIKPHPKLQDFVVVRLQVSQVSPVRGYPNLFESTEGKAIDVNIPTARAQTLSLRPGIVISGRVRKSNPTTAFVHPDLLSVR